MKNSLFLEIRGPGKQSIFTRRVEQLYILNTISQSLNGDNDARHMCEVVVENLKTVFAEAFVFVALAYPEKGVFEIPYFVLDGVLTPVPPTPIGQGLTSIVLSTKKTLAIQQDMERKAVELGAIKGAAKHPKSWIGVPIVWNGNAFGVLSIQNFEHDDFFSAEDISFLEAISETIAGTLENARTYNEATRRANETRALLTITEKISSSLELDAVLTTISTSAREILTTKTSAVYLLDEASHTLNVVAASGEGTEALITDSTKLGEGIIGTVAVTGCSEIINDLTTDCRAVHIEGSDTESDKEKLMAIPLCTHGKILGVLAIWRDSTEAAFSNYDLEFGTALANHAATALGNAKVYAIARAARKEAEDANLIKSRFLTTMSHELRTPLNAIINFSFLLAQGTEGGVNAQQADLLARIETSGRHLLALINDVLDLAKIEAGKMELSLEDIELEEFIQETTRPVPGLIGCKPIQFSVELPENPPVVKADRMRLRQVLLNLLSNAAKFTETGFIRLKLTVHGDSLRFRVEDSGIGMDQKDLPRALTEFTQLDSGTARSAGGTGLGLSIASRFIELHGSRLEASGAVGKGSCFWFDIGLSAANAGKRTVYD